MKKYIFIFAAAILMACGFTVYGSDRAEPAGQQDTLRIVTTIFPEYDWVRKEPLIFPSWRIICRC